MFIKYYLILVYFLAIPVQAQMSDPEWPCIQVLVPEIVPAVVWPMVIDESLTGTWKQDESLVAMVDQLSDLNGWTDSERELIARFVESIPENDRVITLNRLADGIVTQVNQRRAQYIRGIKRYTRQQIAISKQIELTLNQLGDLERQSDSQSVAGQAEIKETLKWHERVYDQRESSIKSLCEIPVELEEKLSRVLRELAQYLP